MIHELFLKDWLVTGFAMEYDDWHAPNSLTRNTPVRSIGNHIGNAFLTPFRNPANVPYLFQRGVPQIPMFHRNEPLRCSPEDYRVMATPTVRVRVSYILTGE